MKVTIIPSLRCAWELAKMGDRYEQKLLDHFKTEAAVKSAEADWRLHHCAPSHPYFTHWLNAIGAALQDYSPSEIKITRIYHTYEV